MDTSFKNICKRFQELDCASLCDASPLVRSLAPELTALNSQIKMVGRAFPISCSNDYLTVVKGLSEANKGDVLVIDGRGQSRAVFGELLAAESIRLGITGAIVNGSVRDTAGMRALDFPVYYRWSNPQAGRAEVFEVQQDVVSMCGVTVTAGDWIIGDADGVIVVPSAQAEEILSVAEEIEKVEAKVFEDVRKGVSLTNIMKFEEFCREHDREIRASLKFNLGGNKQS